MWNVAVPLLWLAGFGDALATTKNGRVVRKRTTENVQLYAYGPDIPGLAIYAGSDNLAYLANTTTNLTAISWTIDTTGAAPWTVTANSTGDASTASTNDTAAVASTLSSAAFYVVADDDSYEQAGFVTNTTSAPAGATTAGFVAYGPYVMLLNASDDNTYVSEFWAETTDTDGVWALKWNEARTEQSGSVPVSLKTTAPILPDE